MAKLTEVIVKRPVTAIMIIAAIIIFGVMSIVSMPQELTPDMDMPMLIVSTVYPGAGPEDVEQLVSSVIKEALGAQSGIRNISSNSMEHVSVIMLQFEFGYDMDSAHNEVSRSIDGIAANLPSEILPPLVMAVDINAAPTMILSVHSESIENLLYYVENEIVPQFNRLSSVASVDVYGGREDYVRIEVIEEALTEHGLTVQNIIQAVTTANHTAPIGTAGFGNMDLGVRVNSQHETIEALNRIPITLRSGDVIRLSDVTNIHISTKVADTISRHNGAENITLNIQKPQAVSANRTSADVNAAIASMILTSPDVSIDIVDDESERIGDAISSVVQTLVLAILLSMIILYLFLGDIRACLIIGSSMPISLLMTFIFMDFMGFTLNLISMSGLIIGVGMMVDNAIVVIDSCFNAKKVSKTFVDAAIEGTKSVMLSILAVTLTTVAVFIPLATIDGMAGQMFGPLGFSIVFALVASLLSAITLVPLFFVRFKPIERENAPVAKLFKVLENGYARLLQFILRKKKTVVAVTIAIMAVSVYIATFINFELMPATDDGIVTITVDARPGLNLESVDTILVEIEEVISGHSDIESFTLRSTGSGSATITAFLSGDRQMQTVEVIEQLRIDTSHILNSDIDVAAGSAGGLAMGGDGIEITIQGDSLDGVREGSRLVEDIMYAHPDIIRVNSTVGRASPQAEIVVDPLMAAAHNVTPPMVTGATFIALNGSEVSEITIDSQRYSIWVQYPAGRYETISDLSNMLIMSSIGAIIPLSDIATIEFTDTPQNIERQNGLYTVSVTGVPIEAARFTAQSEIEASANELVFPAGVSLGQGFADEVMAEEFASLGIAIIIAILLVFMIMSIQFESIRHSLMVMTCIPLAVIGSLLLMFITGTTISMVSLLGFLILIGLVVNNGILFVDTTNRYRETMELQEALIHAGRTRLRPILMITLTTILAMLPLALGIGSAEIMQGLGITVIGGLTASTLLALLLLPTFYLIIDGNSEKRANKKKKAEQL